MSYTQPASAEDEKELLVVGVMSGTSGDGVDVAVLGISPGVARSTGEGSKGGGGGGSWVPPTVSLRGFRTVPFTEETRKLLFQLFSQSLTLAEVCDANFELGRVFGHAVLGTLQELGIPPTEVDLVASHGQTIYHNPPHSTLQIGEAAVIAELVGVTVVGDFRVADVAAGGQGAPITSTVDSMLLASPDGWRAVQNIGGFGNVTFVPPRTQPPITTGEGARQRELRQSIAFDTGPGNALLDWVVDRLTNGVQQYDRDGQLAAAAEPDPALLQQMLSHPYFARPPPKTTGREEFTFELAAEWLKSGLEAGLSKEQIISTFTELTVVSIADAYAMCGLK